MPRKDKEEYNEYMKEYMAKKRAEKKALEEVDRRLQEKLRIENQVTREEETQVEELIIETNKLPAVEPDPEEVKEFPNWGKEVSKPFISDPRIKTIKPDCYDIQSKLIGGKELTLSEKSHISNCNDCSLFYKKYGYHIGREGIVDLWEGEKKGAESK